MYGLMAFIQESIFEYFFLQVLTFFQVLVHWAGDADTRIGAECIMTGGLDQLFERKGIAITLMTDQNTHWVFQNLDWYWGVI